MSDRNALRAFPHHRLMLPALSLYMLRLSAARDGHALARAYLDAARELLGGAETTLLEVHMPLDAVSGTRTLRPGETIVRRFDARAGAAGGRRPVDLRGVHASIAQRRALELPAADAHPARLLLPIAGEGNPRRVLTIDEPADSPEARVALLQLSEIFANQSALIDQRERDALTGLLNRQALAQRYMQMLGTQAAGPDRATQQLWLAVLDLDHFKRVNDRYGHLIGDEVLLHLARLMESTFRYSDALFRFGGEEFVILMHGDAGAAARVFERFRQTVAAHAFPRAGNVTVSIGYTGVAADMPPPVALDIADRALYAAKAAGRDRVVRGRSTGGPRRVGEVEMF